MRTAGKFLIFSAVVLRALVVVSDTPEFYGVAALLVSYGLLLLAGNRLALTRLSRRIPPSRVQLAYLFLQSALVLGVLLVSDYEDFLAELFIPLSLDAVSFFGKSIGFKIIGFFSLALTGALFFSDQGPLFGLTMGLLYSGLCFIFGGYAGQIQKAEGARLQTQRTFVELQAAHSRLQGYADRLVSLAVERERGHLARDLHDSVTQTVFSMNLAAQSARLLWEKEPAQVEGQLHRLEDLAASAQREIQSLVSHLKPPPMPETGLPAALHSLVREQRSKNGLVVSLEVHGEGSVSESDAAGLYAIAQEALNNTARHSGVCEAVVRLHLEAGRSCLEVEDQGRGFDTRDIPARPGHLGLSGMRERAHEMGWYLSVESKPGHGTRIQVTGQPVGDPQ